MQKLKNELQELLQQQKNMLTIINIYQLNEINRKIFAVREKIQQAKKVESEKSLDDKFEKIIENNLRL